MSKELNSYIPAVVNWIRAHPNYDLDYSDPDEVIPGKDIRLCDMEPVSQMWLQFCVDPTRICEYSNYYNHTMIGTDENDDEDLRIAFSNEGDSDEEIKERREEIEKEMAKSVYGRCIFIFSIDYKQCPKKKSTGVDYCEFHNHVIFSPELRRCINEIHEVINKLMK